MKRVCFDDIQSLGKYMFYKAQDGVYTVAVLFYDKAMALLRELAAYDEVNILSLEIAQSDFTGYDQEYYVSISDDMVVCVEPACVNDRYLGTDADLLLVEGDANSAVLKDMDESKCREIYICEYCDENMDDEDCEINQELEDVFKDAKYIKDKDGNVVEIKVDAKKLFDYLFNH